MKKGSKKLNKLEKNILITILVSFAAGVIIGYSTSRIWPPTETRYVTASTEQIETAKREITAEYEGKNLINCQELGQPYELEAFNDYLKVNRYANRAVVRVCNSVDMLLALGSMGWYVTNVNMNLDSRVNPEWQDACMISDITEADDEVRSENYSIDESNYQECENIKKLDIETSEYYESSDYY